MSADLKPGDRVRVQSDWSKLNGEEGTIESLRDGTDGPGCYVNLDRHGPGCHFAFRELEPATAAPASEPEMRDGCPAKALAYLMPHERTAEQAPVVLTAGKMRESVTIIARHLAERDARIAELERERDEARAAVTGFSKLVDRLKSKLDHESKRADSNYEDAVGYMRSSDAAEARARAAEAALAGAKQAVRDYHFALDTRQHGGIAADRLVHAVEAALGMPWEQGSELRSRTITAEGAETGSATHE